MEMQGLLPNVENAPLILNGLIVKNPFITREDLYDSIARHYKSASIEQVCTCLMHVSKNKTHVHACVAYAHVIGLIVKNLFITREGLFIYSIIACAIAPLNMCKLKNSSTNAHWPHAKSLAINPHKRVDAIIGILMSFFPLCEATSHSQMNAQTAPFDTLQ